MDDALGKQVVDVGPGVLKGSVSLLDVVHLASPSLFLPAPSVSCLTHTPLVDLLSLSLRSFAPTSQPSPHHHRRPSHRS